MKGNHTGIVWYRKTKQQKELDIQKHFFKSLIPEFEKRIKQTTQEIEKCEVKIERLIPQCIHAKIMDKENKIKKIKEKITFAQKESRKIKARRWIRQVRTKRTIEEAFEIFEKGLLTKVEMIDIIKRGVL